MNRKVFTALSFILLLAALFVGVGRTRSSAPTSAASASTVDADKESAMGSANPTAPIRADDNASATARDVLIAARNARQAPALVESSAWVNSEPRTLESLRGRVVVVDFWTFGCYNCRNTLPTLKRLDASYRAKGLTIIGVQTPELDSEKSFETVQQQVRALGIKYPVVTDNDAVTWRAYDVAAWPTIVILDRAGRIRYTHIGEGAYDVQEQVIKTLLAEKETATANTTKDLFTGARVVKTDAEWRRELTPEQYHVMREQGTERAFTGAYNDHHERGVYRCASCGLPLFSSDAKFESGTGWPSFYQPIAKQNVTEEVDHAYGTTRTEVVCSRCRAHLGHVFDDGPQPTGLRYCMNSVALNFAKAN